MNPIYLLFFFVFMLSACHSHKEACTKVSHVQEVARSDIAFSDIDAYISKFVNRDVVVTLDDVVVQYQGEQHLSDDTAKLTSKRSPDIRSPTTLARLSIGQVKISDKSEESTNIHVEDNSIQKSNFQSNESDDIEQQENQESAQLQPSRSSIIMTLLCILLFAVVLGILYKYKGKLKL